MQRPFALQKNLVSFPQFTLISIFINEISVIKLGDQTSAITFNIFTPQGGALRQFFFGQAGRFGFLSQFVDSIFFSSKRPSSFHRGFLPETDAIPAFRRIKKSIRDGGQLHSGQSLRGLFEGKSPGIRPRAESHRSVVPEYTLLQRSGDRFV